MLAAMSRVVVVVGSDGGSVSHLTCTMHAMHSSHPFHLKLLIGHLASTWLFVIRMLHTGAPKLHEVIAASNMCCGHGLP